MTPQSRAQAGPDADDATVIQLSRHEPEQLAQAAWEPSDGTPNSAIPFTETAVLRTTLVSGPGRTQADSAPPSQAELTAEQAALNASNPGPSVTIPDPGQWIYRRLSNARTYQIAGYLESGAATLLLQQATVSGPGVRP